MRFRDVGPGTRFAGSAVLAFLAMACAGTVIADDPQPRSQPQPIPQQAMQWLQQGPPPVVSPGAVLPAAPPRNAVYPQVSMASFTREYRSRPLMLTGNAAAIEKALERRDIELNFSETPLRDVVTQLGEQIKLPLLLDVKALEEVGVDLDTPITARLTGISLRSALKRMLGQMDLAFTIADESLVVTSKEAASENLVVRVYPLPWGFAADAGADLQKLVDLVMSTVAPGAWDESGGPGAIRFVELAGQSVFVVWQTLDVHADVEGVFRSLHQRAFADFGDAETPRAAVPVCRVLRVPDAPTRATLAEKLFDLCNASLGKAGDPNAEVTEVAESLVVLSVSPEFHAIAARMVAAIAGVTREGAEAVAGADSTEATEP